MNDLIIKFILLFSPLFKKMGVNPEQLEIILKVKLTMDDRRPQTIGRRRQSTQQKNNSWMALIFMGMMGLIMLFLLSYPNTIMGHALYLTVFMVMMALTLVSDFTTVLIDVRDNFIILPRPVNDSTVTVSRILHIAIHISKLVFAITLPGLIYIGISAGVIAAITFMIEILSATVFCIFMVNIIYLIVLKVSSPERFKNFISYFQILFSVFIFGAYQIMPRLMMNETVRQTDLLSHTVSYFMPQVWLASFYDVIVHPEAFSYLKLALAIAGLLIPFIAIFIVIYVLAPGFNRKLSSIQGSGGESEKIMKPGEQPVLEKKSIVTKLSSLLASDPVEQAGFRLTWWLSSRYRDFKVKVYPSFAYVPVYFVYMFVFNRPRGEVSDPVQHLQSGKGYLMLAYCTSFVILAVLGQVTQAEKYKAAWIMFATPHDRPGRILAGMYKALMVKYFIPYYLAISAFGLYMWGLPVLNDLVLAFFNTLIYGILIALVTVRYLPFSQPAVVESGKISTRMFVMILIGILGFVHYGLSRWEWMINIWMVLSAVIFFILLNYFQKRDWEAMEADYS